VRPQTLRSNADLSAGKPHGTRAKYLGGCRCVLCRAANARYSTERNRLSRAGLGNPIVAADAARRHILHLAKQGVGYKAVSAASDVNHSIVLRIRQGKQKNIRRLSEQKILAITKDALSDAAVVSAKDTLRMIRALLGEGFTKKELSKRLGYKNGALQFKDRILARNASRVERFYRQIMRAA
jgi:hypothetical protein